MPRFCLLALVFSTIIPLSAKQYVTYSYIYAHKIMLIIAKSRDSEHLFIIPCIKC